MADIGYRNGFRAVSESLPLPPARASQHLATFLTGLVSIRPRCVGGGVRALPGRSVATMRAPLPATPEKIAGVTPVTNLMPYVTENGA